VIFAALLPVCLSFCQDLGQATASVKMNSDSEVVPEEVSLAAFQGDFERVKAWLAGGSATAPRSVNDIDDNGWTLLMCTATCDAMTPEHVEFARYLISRGAVLDVKSRGTRRTALHFACMHCREADAALVSVIVAAGANVNLQTIDGETPLFMIKEAHESMLDVVTTLLRAGTSLDYQDRQASIRSFEEHLNSIDRLYAPGREREDIRAVGTLVASVRAAGSWKAYCRLPHKQILRLRSLVARGRTKERLATTRAIRFIVRQGDNGVVWNILSYWRETG
jgi:hypothetical protein